MTEAAMPATRWPRCSNCGSRLPEGAPGTPVTRPIPPPPVEFVRILKSHLGVARTAARTPTALLINDTEAGRCGIGDATTLLGIPVERDNSLPIGRARLKLAEGDRYDFLVPVYFTED